MLVAIIGRITGAAGTCIASTVGTVGTAGTAVGIPVTGRAPELPAQTWEGRTDTTTQDLAPILKRWVYRDSAFTPANLSLLNSRPHDSESPISQDRIIYRVYRGLEAPGLDNLTLGPLLSLPVAGLTGPSPPPSPSSVPRRSFPGCRHQGPEPQVLLHPGGPGWPCPAIAAAFSSRSPVHRSACRLRRLRCILSGYVRVGARG